MPSARKSEINLQLLDSPGARERSTANIAGWISYVGRGCSASISSAGKFPITFGLLPLLENLGVIGLVAARHLEDALLVNGELGVGLVIDMDETSAVGESMDIIPAENDDDRLCPRVCRGFGDVIVGVEGLSVDVMSMLPPPSTVRFSSEERTTLSVCN